MFLFEWHSAWKLTRDVSIKIYFLHLSLDKSISITCFFIFLLPSKLSIRNCTNFINIVSKVNLEISKREHIFFRTWFLDLKFNFQRKLCNPCHGYFLHNMVHAINLAKVISTCSLCYKNEYSTFAWKYNYIVLSIILNYTVMK